MLFVSVALLAAALSLGTTQIYQLSYALLGLLVAALVLGLAGSRALGVERRFSGREGIMAGEPTTVGLRLTNGSRLVLSGIEVVDLLPQRNVSRPSTVPAGGERFVETTVSFARRGLYTIGPVRDSLYRSIQAPSFLAQRRAGDGGDRILGGPRRGGADGRERREAEPTQCSGARISLDCGSTVRVATGG